MVKRAALGCSFSSNHCCVLAGVMEYCLAHGLRVRFWPAAIWFGIDGGSVVELENSQVCNGVL